MMSMIVSMVYANRKNVSEMGPDHPKRCSSIGGPWESSTCCPNFKKKMIPPEHDPRGQVFEGVEETLDFHNLLGLKNAKKKKHENAG